MDTDAHQLRAFPSRTTEMKSDTPSHERNVEKVHVTMKPLVLLNITASMERAQG